MAVGRVQVGDWLLSMGLEHYLQAFLDNGYDDLEMCRQIGHPDLDAIGVGDRAAREAILASVRELLERASLTESSNPVYYTLENPRAADYDEPPGPGDVSPPGCHGFHGRQQAFCYATAPRPTSRKWSPKSMYPPTPPPPRRSSRGSGAGVHGVGGLDNAAVDISDHDPAQKTRDSAHTCSLPVGNLPFNDDRWSSDSAHSDLGSRSRHTSGSSGNDISRRLPGVALEESFTMNAAGGSSDSLSKYDVPDDQQDRGKKKASTIQRFFRPKASSPKASSKPKYMPHRGDPSAQEITMGDKERMLLMLQVKSGKITQEEAVEKVKQHTTARLLGSQAKSMYDITQADQGPKPGKKSHQKHEKQPFSRIKNFFSAKKHNTKSTWHQPNSMQEAPSTGTDPSHPAPHPLSPVPSPEEYQLPRPTPPRGEGAVAEMDNWQGAQVGHRVKSSQVGQEDLNSSGMSEHTASSSQDSVHSYSEGPSRSSSSSLEDPSHPRQVISLARAIVDCTPNVFDKEALYLKKGDIIQVLDKHESGNWRGRLKNGRVGYFKFINVELITEDEFSQSSMGAPPKPLRKPRVTSEDSALVEGFLTNLQLTHLISVFHLNGYETLEQFQGLTEDDLSLLDITHPDDLSKIRTAISCLQSGKGIYDLDSSDHQRDSTATLCPSSPSELRGDQNRESRSSKLYRPSGIMDPHSRQRKTMIPTSRKIDSGFVSLATNSFISVESSRSRDSSSDSQVRVGNEVPLHRSLEFLNERQGVLRDRRTLATSHQLCDRDSNDSSDHRRNILTPSNKQMSREKHKSEFSRDSAPRLIDQKRNTFTPSGKQLAKDTHKLESGGVSPHGSASKIPQIRSRTNSLDKPSTQSSPRNPGCRDLVSDGQCAYSSAPSTPLLQRGNRQSAKHSRRSRDKLPDSPSQSRGSPNHSRSSPSSSPSSRSESPDTGLVTSHSHILAGVKTAHIRSLGLTHVSRSTPSSPAAIPRISPATRSSVHAISRTSRQTAKPKQRGVEARATDPIPFHQGGGSQSALKGAIDVGVGESVTIATILKATGLSMYEPEFSRHGVVSAQHFVTLKENDFRNLGVYNKDHIQSLVTWQRQLDFENGLNQEQDRTRPKRVSDLTDKV